MKRVKPCETGWSCRILVRLIRLYQSCLSGLKPACCRFSPSCSEYARQALLKHGVRRGGWLAVRRVLRCHPLYRGPIYDPVPSPIPGRSGQ